MGDDNLRGHRGPAEPAGRPELRAKILLRSFRARCETLGLDCNADLYSADCGFSLYRDNAFRLLFAGRSRTRRGHHKRRAGLPLLYCDTSAVGFEGTDYRCDYRRGNEYRGFGAELLGNGSAAGLL